MILNEEKSHSIQIRIFFQKISYDTIRHGSNEFIETLKIFIVATEDCYNKEKNTDFIMNSINQNDIFSISFSISLSLFLLLSLSLSLSHTHTYLFICYNLVWCLNIPFEYWQFIRNKNTLKRELIFFWENKWTNSKSS